jgi:hypothetical protein
MTFDPRQATMSGRPAIRRIGSKMTMTGRISTADILDTNSSPIAAALASAVVGLTLCIAIQNVPSDARNMSAAATSDVTSAVLASIVGFSA